MQKIRKVLSDPAQARSLAAHMWRHFKEDRCMDEAASLSYTSLLSLVPLLAVIFGVISAFPVAAEWSAKMQSFIFDNMLPAAGEQVHGYLMQFVDSVSSLTLPGTLILIVTALMLMMRIEKAFNLIWRVPVSRSLINKVTMYWAVLTLGPLALGAATALNLQPLVDMLVLDEGSSSILRSIGVFVLTWLAFALMFVLVPNCRVPLSYAALGAFLSTCLFSLAKIGFVAYVSKASFNVIYGALATIPIFLFWLYLVWGVILLGASLAASLTTFSDRRSSWRWPPEWELLLVFRLIGHLYAAQDEGRSISTQEMLEFEPGVPSSNLKEILARLVEEHVITQDEEGWLLKRNLDHYSLMNLYQAGEYHLPLGKESPVPEPGRWDQVFMKLMAAGVLDMDRPLSSLYDQTTDAGDNQPEAENA